MGGFKDTNWADGEFALKYLENADLIIPERSGFMETLASFGRHFLGGRPGAALLDLGCGDGAFTGELLKLDGSMEATLVDASGEMIQRARERLGGFKNVKFIEASFEDLMEEKVAVARFDLASSALALHHLPRAQRGEMNAYVHSLLTEGGWFINMDVCLSPSETLEEWYLKLWEERIVEEQREAGVKVDYESFMRKHGERKHHMRLDTLTDQLGALEKAGFKMVDCFRKYGIFAIYGGRK
ncbi:MAG: methyltransferase domain-containing protein [Thermodesulfobacteriota bacterium]